MGSLGSTRKGIGDNGLTASHWARKLSKVDIHREIYNDVFSPLQLFLFFSLASLNFRFYTSSVYLACPEVRKQPRAFSAIGLLLLCALASSLVKIEHDLDREAEKTIDIGANFLKESESIKKEKKCTC